MELNADGTLSLPAMRLTTAEVEQLIHDLAQLRNHMTPEVPQDMRELTGAVIQHNPHVSIGNRDDGSVVMGIRHRGLGWTIFTLDLRSAASIRDALVKRTNGVHGIDESPSDGGRAH